MLYAIPDSNIQDGAEVDHFEFLVQMKLYDQNNHITWIPVRK